MSDNNKIHGEFTSDEFSKDLIGRTAFAIFHWRLPILIFGIIVTLALSYTASKIQVTAGFTKMIPNNHEYMSTFNDYKSVFGGADKILIAIKAKEGDIFDPEIMDTVKNVAEDTFYIRGVVRSSLTSIYSPEVRYNEIVEAGIKSGNLVPADFAGTPDQMQQVKTNILKSNWLGRIVSNDMTATMVMVTLGEKDFETGERYDLQEIGAELEKIRAKYESDKVSIHIIGFAKSVSEIASSANDVLMFFAIAFVLTAVLLYWYSASLMLTAWALIVSIIPVIWLIGILPLIGMGLDPMSILVPFLIFAIGVSHAVQMTNAWKLETLAGNDGVTASRNCFLKLFTPGVTALLANALGFMVIAVVDIEIVKELAITSTIGVSVMIITNKVLLPILLSYMRFSATTAQKLSGKETVGNELWKSLSPLATKKGAIVPIVVSLVIVAFGFVKVKDLQVGDQGKGVPELRPTSVYNQDVDMITRHFAIGVDLLQVIVEAQGDDAPCVKHEVQDKMEEFEFTMRQLEGVVAVRGLSGFVKSVTQDFAEGWTKWHILPETVPQIAQGVGFATRLGNEYRNSTCDAIPISIYTSDHQAETIKRVVAAIKEFKAKYDDDQIEFRLASGNVGIMAATNEVVHEADKWVNLTLFTAVGLLCYITFRSFKVTLCIVIPLGIVTLLCNAIMAMLDIGLKVNTLPVIAIAVGVGVDYGIYLFERMKHEMENRGMTLREAFVESLIQRGTASVFTAVTMTISVTTWIFSTLKFQADMGVLLAFMFVVNLLGAILLMPALAAFFVGDSLTQKKRKK